MNSVILISPDRGETFNQFFLVTARVLAINITFHATVVVACVAIK